MVEIVTLNSKEEVIEEIEAALQIKNNLYIVDPSGYYKTNIIIKGAQKEEYEVIKLNLQTAIRSDLTGKTVIYDEEINGEIVKCNKRAMPNYLIPVYENPDKKYLLLFEDMDKASIDILRVTREIVGREFKDITFSNLVVFATGENPINSSLFPEIFNRFCNIKVPE
jgi:hypothetical protein